VPTLVANLRKQAGRRDIDDVVTQLAVLVACADEEIDDFEVEILLELYGALGDPPEDARARMEAAADRTMERGLDAMTAEVGRALLDADAVEAGIVLAVAIAYANSGIAHQERTLIEQLADVAGLRGDALATLVEQARVQIEAVSL
jgi:tellurite resistance protein